MASVLVFQQVCPKFHKDFTLDQVNRSSSFLGHLISIQLEQRRVIYSFAEHLKRLKECVSVLGAFFSSSFEFTNGTPSKCSIAEYRHANISCMWQQKVLFDTLHEISNEELLLLRTVESTHVNSCQSVKVAANKIIDFITKFNKIFLSSKESLDNMLLDHNGSISAVPVSLCPHVVSLEGEQLIAQNLHVLKNFEEHLFEYRRIVDGNSVEEALLFHFNDVLKKGKLMVKQFNSSLETGNGSTSSCQNTSFSNHKDPQLGVEYGFVLKRIRSYAMDALQKLSSLSNGQCLSESLGNIATSGSLFETYVANLNVDQLCDDLEAIFCAETLLYQSGHGAYLHHLHVLLVLLLNFGNCLLQDFMAVHKTVCRMTHVLANIFASLYSQGFGVSAEDHVDGTSLDVSGTGMEEDTGLNYVSDQKIYDEDQLFGTSEKQAEERDASGELPGNNDKGIEVEQDEDGDIDQLESGVLETGAVRDVIDENLWEKDDEDNPSDTTEKYEYGSSVRDRDANSWELRAKEGGASTADEPGKLNSNEADKVNDEIESQYDLSNTENVENKSVDKETAFADCTGLKIDEMNQSSEDIGMDEKEFLGSMGEAYKEEHDESIEGEKRDGEKGSPVDEATEGEETEQMNGDQEKVDSDREGEANTEVHLLKPREDRFEPGSSDFPSNQEFNAESATQPKGGNSVHSDPAPNSRYVAPEAIWPGGNDVHNDPVPTRGLPSDLTSEMDAIMENESYGRFDDDQQETQLPQNEYSSIKKNQPNPYRNVWDALEEWKERVKVSDDPQTENMEMQDEIKDGHADEDGYVSQHEKGNTQALGPTTSDQADRNANGCKPDGDNLTGGDDLAEMDLEKLNPETNHIESSALSLENKMEQMQITGPENLSQDGSPGDHIQDDFKPRSQAESLVSVKKSYFDDDIHQLSQLSLSDNEVRKAQDLEEISIDEKNKATALWGRYELRTTRLSQELAEQLRLVLEPTVASKLQGDYRTGKRLNIKKIIPYIASNYRKDKIWLRRTRPNNRDYQVVIAVDDSRSMSESHCGDVAIEALVTVCRAMSQLDMGNLAVASFGQKGNIRLLLNFHQPFTREAGVKMISSLTFKQENTITDEPVVDLLKYLNNLLDAEVSKAWLPSGKNPLQQLVLIIADGRFHEKENLKRCVRDALSQKRMVAFLLVDSPQESIMDLMEASFQGGDIKFTKYLDSFPFPYYIVLKDIEALPRTLADLLRQWFELMQNSRD